MTNQQPTLLNKFINKLNDLHNKALANLAKQKAEIELKKQQEEQRKAQIKSGNIQPIQMEFSVNLDMGELPYALYSARRIALVEYIEEHTEGRSKKTGGIKRAIVGGVLLGGVGAIVGSNTAGSKFSSITKQKKIEKLEEIDSGTVIFTNKRILFIGQNIVSLPYKEIISVGFDPSGHELHLKYPNMLDNEFFDLSGPNAKDARIYFEGITNNLLLK